MGEDEDETRPANAADLRSQIERETRWREGSEKAFARVDALRKMPVWQEYGSHDPIEWFRSPRQASSSFLKLQLLPREPVQLEMETPHEDRLKSLIRQIYPRVVETLGKVAVDAESRGADFYEYAWYHYGIDFEMKWRTTAEGDTAHTTQIRKAGGTDNVFGWSIVDLAVDLVLFLKLSMEWWRLMDYYGDGRLYAQLNVQGLQLARAGDGSFVRIFDPTLKIGSGKPLHIQSGAVLVSTGAASASVETYIDYSQGTTRLVQTVTAMLNRLLRSLGHRVTLNELEKDIAGIVARVA